MAGKRDGPPSGVFLRGKTWWIRYRHGGKQIFESSESDNWKDAEKLLIKRRGEIGIGRYIGPEVDRTKFTDLVTMIEDNYAIHGRRSAARLKSALKRLREYFGATKVRAITSDRIAAYIRARMDDGAARATIHYELSILRRMFTLGVRAKKIVDPPYIENVTVNNARQGFFEAADFRAVVSHLPEPLQAVAEFGYLTGWRVRSEVLPLTWDRVNFDAGTIRLEPGTTKNDEGREFPFTALPELAALLERQRDLTSALERKQRRIIPFVFHRSGQRIKSYDKAWQSACKAAGLEGRVVHDLRRTAVRNLEQAGVPRSVAMKLTGHKTEAVYRRYAIVSAADLSEGVAKLATLHARPAVHRTVVSLADRIQNEDNRAKTVEKQLVHGVA